MDMVGRLSAAAIRELLDPPVRALGYELVDVECRSGGESGLLRLYIDSPAGITLDDCEKVNRQVGAFLDVEDPMPGHYVLEVSSPGEDRILRTREHFQRFTGHTVRVQLRKGVMGRRRFRGELLGLDDAAGEITVRVDGEEHHLPLDDIERARLAP
jgi:ribosome maturation factor RimP